MGEAKRRRKLDPDYGKKPVQVKIEKSDLTGKWLVVAYILGQRFVVSPHYKKEDAYAASEQVFHRFNTLSVHEWHRHLAGDTAPAEKALRLLDYEDDDEVIGVIPLNRQPVDGNIFIDCTRSTIERATEVANQKAIEETGKPLYRPAPGSWLDRKDSDE